MIFFKANMLLLLLSGSALALPKHGSSKSGSNDSSSNSKSGSTSYSNSNAYNTGTLLTCSVDGETQQFYEDAAKYIAKIAPSGKDIKTTSSYPHIFHNKDGITWDNDACNSNKVKTLEFPIFTNGEEYKWNGVVVNGKTVEKKPNPGQCRVVYSETDGHYCGVMCHKSTTEKGFNKCT